MSTFSNLIADINQKEGTLPAPPPPGPRRQKRKHDGSMVGGQPQAKGPKLAPSDFATKSPPLPSRRSDYFNQPYDINQIHLAEGLSEVGCETPSDYAHGPRYQWQNGPLIGYSVHANLLRGQLAVVKEHMTYLHAKHDEAVGDWERAERRLMEHLRDEKRFYRSEGYTKETIRVWERRRDRFSRQSSATERALQRVKDEMKARRLPPL